MNNAPAPMTFVHIGLKLREGIHIGAGRAGMVSRSHGFVPGHVLAYAIAAVLGRRLGGRPADYDRAIASLRDQLRCGPLFIRDHSDSATDSPAGWLFPRRDRARIERDYLIGVNHVTLDGSARRHIDGGLFEVEAIAPCRQTGHRQPTRLNGGLWFARPELEGQEVRELISAVTLGGERNAGLGRVTLETWQPAADTYCGLGRIGDETGTPTLLMAAGDCLPGPALGGVGGSGWQPWLGRLHDNRRGAGRRFSQPVLIRMDGLVSTPQAFTLESSEAGFGCWTPVASPPPPP